MDLYNFEYLFKNKKNTIISIVVILAIIGVSFYFAKDTNVKDNDTVWIASDDEEMNLAIEKAQSTINNFENALLSNDSNLDSFSLKVRYEHENGAEHIWFSEIYFEDNEFYGYVDNDPIDINEIKYGDLVKINKNDITDWLYYKNDTCYGGYTIRVIINRMSAKEQEEAGMQFMIFAKDSL